MITKLSVSNFKSVRQLDIECKKVNLFIGEPNTGKSNILEALALMSWWADPGQNLSEYVRFETVQNLFYDQLVMDREIYVSLSLSSEKPEAGLCIRCVKDLFELRVQPTSDDFATMDYLGRFMGGTVLQQTKDVKFFRFNNLAKYTNTTPGVLKPPDGANFFSVVFGSENLRATMKEFFRK